MDMQKKARQGLGEHDGQTKNIDGKRNILPAVEDVKSEIQLTYWQDIAGFEKKDVTLTWSEFCEKVKNLPRQQNKEKSPLIKLATFGQNRTGKGCLRHDANVQEIYGVEGDLDSGEISFDDTLARLEQANIRAMVVTTHSHTPNAPRLRILAPLSGANSPLSRRVLVARLNGVLGGHLASESFNLSQSFFIGGRPGGEYRAECTFDDPEDGWCVDEMPELDAILDFGKATEQEPDKPEVGELNEDLKAAVKAGLEPEHIGGGKWILHCPWRNEHTKNTVKSSTSYFEPHTNGYKGGGFKCLHDHCSHRTIKDFREKMGIKQPDPPKEFDLSAALVDADRFPEIPIQPKTVYLHPWVTSSQVILVSGWRNSGKTMFVMSMLDSITKKMQFGPWSCELPETCLYMDGEMVADDVIDRLKGFGLGNRQCPLLIYSDYYANSLGLSRANLLDEKWRAAMQKLLIENNVKIWAVDNLASLTPGADENVKSEWDPVNQWFLELRFQGITSVLVHHTGKGGAQRGTSAREDNIDISIGLERPANYHTEDGARFVCKFHKSRIKTADLPYVKDYEFQLREQDGRYVWTYCDEQADKKRQVLTMLDQGFKQKDIADELGMSTSNVTKIKNRALSDGILTKDGRLTQSGYQKIRG
jgi:hypothetical protein